MYWHAHIYACRYKSMYRHKYRTSNGLRCIKNAAYTGLRWAEDGHGSDHSQRALAADK
jgi:hypothetical protein